MPKGLMKNFFRSLSYEVLKNLVLMAVLLMIFSASTYATDWGTSDVALG